MRINDWSSDVCSSDLAGRTGVNPHDDKAGCAGARAMSCVPKGRPIGRALGRHCRWVCPMFKAIFRSSICLAAVAASSTAAAAETAHAVAADADSIIVTATRAPLTLGEIPSSVAVLDKEARSEAHTSEL